MGHLEFVLLMATMSALDAFSIDAMLPALNMIGEEFAIPHPNDRQLVVTALFLGFSIGVLCYGFLADSFGRRKPVLGGFLAFIAGSLLCIVSSNFNELLMGRVLQGFGAAGPYVLAITIVRDQYSGEKMAKTMSLIMMVFILVPMVAPFIGQGILMISGWRSIFGVLLAFSIIGLVWFFMRQHETLKPEHRQKFQVAIIAKTTIEICSNKQSFRYLLAMAATFGGFMAYLSTGQQVFQDIYPLGEYFPVVFASMAAIFGLSSYLNARWVESFGSARLVHYAFIAIVITSGVFYLIYVNDAHAPLWAYLLYLCIVLFAYGFLFGNINALALAPLGHIAGSASSLINALSTGIAVLLASLIGSKLDHSVLSLVAGFGILGLIAGALNYPLAKNNNRS